VIAQALQDISTLRILHLRGNNMSGNVAKDLAAAIKNNHGLEDLHLISNNNFQFSIALILQSLMDTTHLKILHISNNSITENAAEPLALVIENNIQLEEVSLPNNEFLSLPNNEFQSFVIMVVHALEKLSKLKKLNLNNNKMSSNVLHGLAEIISNNNLSELFLSNNDLQSSVTVIVTH